MLRLNILSILTIFLCAIVAPADIEDGGERIDVHMDLAALPLPMRLAGLDRDPGWIPAAACDVRFHFH